jgi:hypothetical protein
MRAALPSGQVAYTAIATLSRMAVQKNSSEENFSEGPVCSLLSERPKGKKVDYEICSLVKIPR